MNLLGQDGPDDVVGAGLDGARAGWAIGKIAALIISGILIVLFHVFKFLLPYIIKFLAFVIPILWRLLVMGFHWGCKAGASAITSLKSRATNKAAH